LDDHATGSLALATRLGKREEALVLGGGSTAPTRLTEVDLGAWFCSRTAAQMTRGLAIDGNAGREAVDGVIE
jgi:hypothetical protein